MTTVNKSASAFLTHSAFSLNEIDPTTPIHDELIERTLGRQAIAMIYGQSNSGKTFMAIDMAMSLSCGLPFLNRQTQQTPVLYVAAEAPSGVQNRMRAWIQNKKSQLNGKVGEIHICPHQIDLFGDTDVRRVLATAKQINKDYKSQLGLIVIDTLARVSGQANENSNDMNRIMQHCDLLAKELNTAVLLIHHSGKNESQGARGWSGVRAFIDTEIEVVQQGGIHVATITKQRDIEGKGEEFAFTLKQVPIGINQWGNLRTTCYIESANIPKKVQGLSTNDRKIISVLEKSSLGLTRGEIADLTKLNKTNCDTRIRILIKAELLYESDTGGKIYIKETPTDVG